MKTGAINISEVDPGESNAQVHARLGDSTGYVPREKRSFGLSSPPLFPPLRQQIITFTTTKNGPPSGGPLWCFTSCLSSGQS